MSEIITSSNVYLDGTATTIKEVFRFFAEKAVEIGVADDADAVYEAFKAREAEGTTGMTGGFAIPHAKCAAITKPAVIVAKFADGITWDSMDGVPITCAIALLTPAAQAGTTHLKMLSQIALALMDASFRSQLMEASEPEEIASLVSGVLVDDE